MRVGHVDRCWDGGEQLLELLLAVAKPGLMQLTLGDVAGDLEAPIILPLSSFTGTRVTETSTAFCLCGANGLKVMNPIPACWTICNKKKKAIAAYRFDIYQLSALIRLRRVQPDF